MTAQDVLRQAASHHQAGRLRDAESLYRQLMDLGDGNGLHQLAVGNLATVLAEQGRSEEALPLFHKALPLLMKTAENHPHAYEHQVNLGIVLRGMGRPKEALASYRCALALAPRSVPALHGLAMSARDLGDLQTAVGALRAALKIQPDDAPALIHLADLLICENQLAEAVTAAQKAIELRPESAEPHDVLGRVHLKANRPLEAIDEFRHALRLNDRLFEVHNNLAGALKDIGKLDEAIASYNRAIQLNPSSTVAASNRIYTLNFHPAYDAAALLRQQKAWNEKFARPLHDASPPHEKMPADDRQLRIGYISPDFRDHVVGRNILPLLRQHDRRQFEIFCYSNNAADDWLTTRLRALCDHWRPIALLGNEEAALAIRRDSIDILVDLALHMNRNRLPLFARKPAPIQVTFGGYPGGTGLETIDYRLTDPHLDPPPNDAFYVEQSIRLPHSFWCYDTEAMELEKSPAVRQLPGEITFGCLNNFCKINDAVVALWRRVLDAVAGSRMLILAPPGDHRQRLIEQLNGRVTFAEARPRLQYLEWYHHISIGLDTFPYNGHTTSLDSYWMGVPVVTLAGQTAVGRAGLSQLSNLGIGSLAASTADEFVSIAANLAADRSRLTELRSTLRQRMIASPLMDAPGFARGIESAYQQMWRAWMER